MDLERCRAKLYPVVENEGDPRFDLAPIQGLPAAAPNEWIEVLRDADSVQRVLERLWLPSRGLLPETIAELQKKLRGIGLLATRFTPFSLVYVFDNKGDPMFRRGFPSRSVDRPEATVLPAEFLDLYRIHDGWTDMNGFMGPLPSEDWFDLSYLLDGDYSKIIPGVRLQDFLIICNSGGSEYLGFDMSKTPPLGLICSVLEPVEVVPDVVRTLDEWMAVDLRDLKPA